jgi:MerR family redox-sensitive transcriptional activator SoxR
VPVERLSIGDVASRTGVATSALRYYEDIGLLRPAGRVSGRRSYTPDAVGIVGMILFLREVGFTLKEIRRLMRPRSSAPRMWRQLANRKVEELDRDIAKATAAKTALEHSLACPRDNILECPNFWNVIGGLLEGKTLTEAHPV